MDENKLAAELVTILTDLIAIPSPYPPGETTAICAYAADRMQRAGLTVEHHERAPRIDNVVARVGSGRPSLVFNAHVDTVGVGERGNWRTDPFKAEVADGHVIGLGAGNCKGSMAVQLWLAEQIAKNGSPDAGEIAFTFVGDEERLGHDGLYYLRENGAIEPTMLVLGAQTENQLITEERGVLWVKLTTAGKAAHAGNPAAGDNAITRMTRLINALENELSPKLRNRVTGDKRSTMSIGLIRGGHNTNVVPAACMIEIDRRVLPDEKVDDAFAEISSIIDAAGEPAGTYQIEFITGTNGFSAPADGPCVAAFSGAIEERLGAPARFLNATGVSDGRYFADDQIEIINFGPGAGAEGHAANESVPIQQLVDAAMIQLNAVNRLTPLKR